MQQEAFAVAARGKGRIEHLGVVERLLDALADGEDRPLDLDYHERDVAGGVEHIVSPLGTALHAGLPEPIGEVAADDDPSSGQLHLFPKLLLCPPGVRQSWGDVLCANVALAEVGDIHADC